MIEKRNIVLITDCVTSLVDVLNNIITVITITNKIAVFNVHGNSKQSKNKHKGDLMFFK